MNEKIYQTFLQWLPTAVPELKGATPEQVHQVVQKMMQTPDGQKQLQQLMEAMQQQMGAQRLQEGGTYYRGLAREYKNRTNSEGNPLKSTKQGRLSAKGMATLGFTSADFNPDREFNRQEFRQRKQEAKDMGLTNRRQIKAYAASELNRTPLEIRGTDKTLQTPGYTSANTFFKEMMAGNPGESRFIASKTPAVAIRNAEDYRKAEKETMGGAGQYPLASKYQTMPSQEEVYQKHTQNGTLGMYFSSVGNMYKPSVPVDNEKATQVTTKVTTPATPGKKRNAFLS